MAETNREFRANPYAGYVDVLPAKRLANAIATIKAVLIGLSLLGTILLIAALLAASFWGARWLIRWGRQS